MTHLYPFLKFQRAIIWRVKTDYINETINETSLSTTISNMCVDIQKRLSASDILRVSSRRTLQCTIVYIQFRANLQIKIIDEELMKDSWRKTHSNVVS